MTTGRINQVSTSFANNPMGSISQKGHTTLAQIQDYCISTINLFESTASRSVQTECRIKAEKHEADTTTNFNKHRFCANQMVARDIATAVRQCRRHVETNINSHFAAHSLQLHLENNRLTGAYLTRRSICMKIV